MEPAITNSSSSFSGSYHASCTTDPQDSSTYLPRQRMLHRLRLGTAVLVLGAATALIACEAIPLQHYCNTSSMQHVGLVLWPLNFDLRPTIALLSCGCVVAFQILIYIFFAVLPLPRWRFRTMDLLAAASSICGFVTALIGVLFVIYFPSSKHPAGFTKGETLQSWTCKWTDAASATNSGVAAPLHFARDCADARAGFALLCSLVGLEIIMGCAAVAGYWLERTTAEESRQEEFQFKQTTVPVKKA